MALRAGYHGVKRKILDELNKLDGILPAGVSKYNKLVTQEDIEVKTTWEALGIMGAVNLCDNNTSFTLVKGSTRTHDHLFSAIQNLGSYEISFTISDADHVTKKAGFKLSDTIGGHVSSDILFDVSNGRHSFIVDFEYSPNKMYFYLSSEDDASATATFSDIMITLASDRDTEFHPYAMTNYQLTGSAADQKTTINAIIAAATGAADFAAFKTAMGAITPVTRSLSIQEPETREASDPAIEEEPVTVKKTTRKKSTAAAETEKEGE